MRQKSRAENSRSIRILTFHHIAPFQSQASLNGELAQRRTALDQQRHLLEARQGSTALIEYQRQLASFSQGAQSLNQQQNGRFIAAQLCGQQQIDRALNEALARVVARNSCSW